MFPLWGGSCIRKPSHLGQQRARRIGLFCQLALRHIFIAHEFSADLIMGIPIHRRCRGPESNILFSHYFEQSCTFVMTQKPHGTFYSVVRRKIGRLNVII